MDISAPVRNRKGFTLPELLAVMVVISILAATSVPFVKGYIRDAKNGKAKAALVQLGEAYKNFKTDYPNSKLESTASGKTVTSETRGTCPAYESINATTDANILINCKYLKPLKWQHMNYTFVLGVVDNSNCPNAYGDIIAYMQGKDGEGDYCSQYYACYDEYGKITDNKGSVCQ